MNFRHMLIASTLFATTANIFSQDIPLVPTVAQSSVTVPDGTEVDLLLAEQVSSAYATVGQRIRFTVERDVVVNKTVVIPAGSVATAVVTTASPKKWAGRSGKLEIAMQNVTAIDGSKVELTGTQGGNGDSHVGRMVTGIVITSIFTLGGSALFLMVHGKDITIPAGSKAHMFTAGSSKVVPVV